MAYLIRTVSHTATGREIRREREVTGAKLTIGRATTNDIVLPDLAVEQHHATLEPASGSQLRMVAAGSRTFAHDGRGTTEAVFDPANGGEFAFGSYVLTMTRESDGLVAITVTAREKDAGARDAVRGFELASAMPGKRALAWIGLAAVLIAFLAIPVWSHLSRADKSPGADGAHQVTMDSSWSAGKLSLAHHGLEDNCEACHVKPFESVRDETCLTCHESIGDHAMKPRLATSRGPMEWSDAVQWDAAAFFGKEGPESCTTCHTEHEGAGRMEPAAQQFCADCHGTMDKRLTDTTLANAGDFGTSHPQFQALVYAQPGSTKPTRISLAGTPREDHGLRFPHDMHLSKTGGVARMANSLPRYDDGLVCADCHTPRADKVGFQPIEMEEDCESCHSLVYDQVGSTFRTLRHGDVEQMRADLAAMDRTPRRAAAPARRRPGEFARGGRYFQDFGRPARNYVGVRQALSRDGVCGECHLPSTDNGQPSVVPVSLRRSYMMAGTFDHGPHEQEQCTTCHLAESSDSATDVLLPVIKQCRDCHLGEDAVRADVPSGCAMCHSYHPPTGRKPADHPDGMRETIARLSRKRR